MNNITNATDIASGAAVICRAADQPEAGGVRFGLTAELTSGPLDVGIERVAQGAGSADAHPPQHGRVRRRALWLVALSPRRS